MLSDIPFYVRNDFTKMTEIAHGSGGRISKGELKYFGQIVVKEFFWSSQQPLEKYKREVEILVKHRHPNIVQLYGILWNGSDSSRYLGYVMEFVEGGSLHDVIYDRTKNYDTGQICQWVKQIALGLQYLHEKQIIHRDIKPDNILVAGSQLKLADFGIARDDFGIARDVDVSLTACVGTFRYMAPEVITTRRYGQAADIYSLAITIWELFHRTKPYTELEGNDLAIILQAVREGARPTFTPEQIDKSMSVFIRRCWHISATDRPSLEEVIDHFGSKADSSVVPVDPAPSFHPPGPVNVRGRPMVSCDSNLTILVLGGVKHGHRSDEMVILKQDKWIKLALKLPKVLDQGGAVYLDGEIYVFGGTLYNELYKLDNKTLKWIRLADMNEERQCITNSSVEWNGSIWVFGGIDLKSVERYDPKENKWIKMPDMKYSRFRAAAAVWNGKFIVCGGRDDSNHLKSVECFDPESGVWTELNDMPTPLLWHCLVSYGNNLILMGGGEETAVNTVLEVSNLEGKGTWKQLPPMKQPRYNFSAAVLDNEIFVIGGSNYKSLDKTEIFNGKSWRGGPQLPNVCHRMSSIVIPFRLAAILSNSTV